MSYVLFASSVTLLASERVFLLTCHHTVDAVKLEARETTQTHFILMISTISVRVMHARLI